MTKTLIGIVALLTLACGCSTPGNTPIATPARIEAVTALGAYFGGQAAIKNGNRPGVERAVSGLKSIEASGKADIPAIVGAIDASGVKFFSSTEGQLTLGAIITFADYWTTNAQPILDDARTRAVLNGTLRGFSLALSSTATNAPPTNVVETLSLDAKQTRR